MLAIVHWMFWVFCPWSETRSLLFSLYTRNLFLVLLPVSTLLWIWRETGWGETLNRLLYFRQTFLYGFSIVVVVIGVFLWHPALNADLTHPQDWKSVEVEVPRGPCYGSCRVYTITAHGDGRVEYAGWRRHSRIETFRSGTLEREKITRVLQILTQARFSTLDGRAFGWAFDTPSVGVRTSVDGRAKEVVCDAWNEKSRVGRKVEFLEATEEIDSILKSASWTSCQGECGEDLE